MKPFTTESLVRIDKDRTCPECDSPLDAGLGFGSRDLDCSSCGWSGSYDASIYAREILGVTSASDPLKEVKAETQAEAKLTDRTIREIAAAAVRQHATGDDARQQASEDFRAELERSGGDLMAGELARWSDEDVDLVERCSELVIDAVEQLILEDGWSQG